MIENIFISLENMHEIPLEFDCMHENKIYNFIFGVRKCFGFVLGFLKISRKTMYFNTWFVCCGLSL